MIYYVTLISPVKCPHLWNCTLYVPVIFYHQFDQLNPPKINQPSFNYNSDSLWSLTEIRESEKAELLSEILSLKWKVTLSN